MIDCRFKPITNWPSAPTTTRTHGPFKATWQKTLDLLEKELAHLRATDVTIEAFFHPADIRNDGWPKSVARPSQPGVILSFETGRGRFVMPCDRFHGWQSNLRAIALTLEHLRAVERYGVTTEQQEQYTGWLRLPEVSAIDEATELARKLADLACVEHPASHILASRELFESVANEALRRNHTDTGGEVEGFQMALTARNRIRELRGWR